MGWIIDRIPTIREVRRGFECDSCGAMHDDTIETQEAVTVMVYGGFGSVFGDGSQLEAVFCQSCAKALLGPYLRDVA